jgi:hypothetical protein
MSAGKETNYTAIVVHFSNYPVNKNDLQRHMHTSQGPKASRFRQVRFRTKEVSDLRDIHQVGWPLVPVLRLQAEDQAEEPEVQGKAAR